MTRKRSSNIPKLREVKSTFKSGKIELDEMMLILSDIIRNDRDKTAMRLYSDLQGWTKTSIDMPQVVLNLDMQKKKEIPANTVDIGFVNENRH